MGNAVYIIASLPMINFGDPAPFSTKELRARCEGLMTNEELATLDALIEGKESSDPFVSAYMSRDVQLKNVVGRLRAASWGPDVRFTERPFAGYDVTFAKMVSDAFAKQDPLEREQDIDRARFWLVDALAGYCEDTMASVYAFAVKLMICERWDRISEEAGNAAVLQVINENDPAYVQE